MIDILGRERACYAIWGISNTKKNTSRTPLCQLLKGEHAIEMRYMPHFTIHRCAYERKRASCISEDFALIGGPPLVPLILSSFIYQDHFDPQ